MTLYNPWYNQIKIEIQAKTIKVLGQSLASVYNDAFQDLKPPSRFERSDPRTLNDFKIFTFSIYDC